MTLTFTYKTSELISTIPRKQYINNGISESVMGMPQKFGVSDGGTTFTLARLSYKNAYSNVTNKTNEITSTVPKQGKPISFQSSGQHIEQKKNNAIGRGSMNKAGSKISFKSVDNNLVNSKLSKCRSSGCVPPPKIAASPSISSKCC